MAVPTKDELLADLEIAYTDFTATATKAQISALLAYLAEPQSAIPGPVSKIIFLDGSGQRTTLDLEAHTVISEGMRETIAGGVDTHGEPSAEIEINLASLLLWNRDVIWFDPHPSVFPIAINFVGEPFPVDPPVAEEPAA